MYTWSRICNSSLSQLDQRASRRVLHYPGPAPGGCTKQAVSSACAMKNASTAGGVWGSKPRPVPTKALEFILQNVLLLFFFLAGCSTVGIVPPSFWLGDTSGFSVRCRQAALIQKLSSVKGRLYGFAYGRRGVQRCRNKQP